MLQGHVSYGCTASGRSDNLPYCFDTAWGPNRENGRLFCSYLTKDQERDVQPLLNVRVLTDFDPERVDLSTLNTSAINRAIVWYLRILHTTL